MVHWPVSSPQREPQAKTGCRVWQDHHQDAKVVVEGQRQVEGNEHWTFGLVCEAVVATGWTLISLHGSGNIFP